MHKGRLRPLFQRAACLFRLWVFLTLCFIISLSSSSSILAHAHSVSHSSADQQLPLLSNNYNNKQQQQLQSSFYPVFETETQTRIQRNNQKIETVVAATDVHIRIPSFMEVLENVRLTSQTKARTKAKIYSWSPLTPGTICRCQIVFVSGSLSYSASCFLQNSW